MAGPSPSPFKKRLQKAPLKPPLSPRHSRLRASSSRLAYKPLAELGGHEHADTSTCHTRPAKRARVLSPDLSPKPLQENVPTATSLAVPACTNDEDDEWEDVQHDPGTMRSEKENKPPIEEKDENSGKGKPKPAPRKISDKLKQWQEHFPSLLVDMLTWEVPYTPINTREASSKPAPHPEESSSETPWRCACRKWAKYRCLECNDSPPRCLTCLRQAHKHSWFHYIEAWNGRFFERYDLMSARFIIHLGHHGEHCPHLSNHTEPSNLVVVHSNGVHNCRLHYCHCPKAPDRISQLVRARLWPSTLDTPRSAFTVDLLRTWHQLWLNAKISTLHFMRALARYTNNTFPADVQDYSSQFRLISRVYAHLTMVKRSGNNLGIVVPGRLPNDILTPCIQCPKPQFNLPDDWQDTPEEIAFINDLTHGGDGNNSLTKRMKRDDKKDDRGLSRGMGAWSDHPRLAEMIQKSYGGDPRKQKGEAGDTSKQDETCSGFKVGRSQRAGKFRFVEISGIVAVTCRHIFFKNGTVVDLITGERYSFMDFAHAGAIRGSEALPRRKWSYDVVCIYIKGMLDRWKEWFPDLVPLIEDMECCLPSFHAHAHRDLCQAVYSMGYAEGWALLHMETVEHPWAEFNAAGAPTSQMTGGAREDALTDLFNFWNRVKLERLVEAMPKALEKAYEIQASTTKQFANLVALAGSQKSLEWASMDIHTTAPTPSNWADKEAAYERSIYVLHSADIPTREKALQELVASFETADKASLESVVAHLRKGAAHFIKQGIELDLQQFVIRNRRKLQAAKDASKKDVYSSSLADSHRIFRTAFVAWRREQGKYMPLLPLPDEQSLLENLDYDR